MKSIFIGFSVFIAILYIGMQFVLFNPIFILDQSPQPQLAQYVVDYLFEDKTLPTQFSEREQLHIQDVRGLYYQISYRMLIVIMLGLLLCLHSVYTKKLHTEFVKKCLFFSLVFQGLFVSVIVTGGFFFTQSFIFFHKLLFTNDLWILPADSATIQAFPQDFFFVITTFLIVYLLTSFITTFVAYNLVKKYGKHHF